MRATFLPLTISATTLALSGVAAASITPVGQFNGQYQEGFEGFSSSWTTGSVPVFSGLASVREKSNGSLIATTAWYFTGVVKPHEGTRFMGSPGGWTEYAFNAPLATFGGFFSTNSSVAGGRAELFLNGQLVSSQPIVAPLNGDWAWNGWSSTAGFDVVRITSNYSSGGFIMQDSLQATTFAVPVPGATAAGAMVVLAALRRRRL